MAQGGREGHTRFNTRITSVKGNFNYICCLIYRNTPQILSLPPTSRTIFIIDNDVKQFIVHLETLYAHARSPPFALADLSVDSPNAGTSIISSIIVEAFRSYRPFAMVLSALVDVIPKLQVQYVRNGVIKLWRAGCLHDVIIAPILPRFSGKVFLQRRCNQIFVQFLPPIPSFRKVSEFLPSHCRENRFFRLQ